jgi:hypothetical protein
MASIIFARVKRSSKKLKEAIKKYNVNVDMLEQCGITKYPRCDIGDAKDMSTDFWEQHDRLSGIPGSVDRQRTTRKAIDSHNLIRRCDEELELLQKEMKSMLAVDDDMISGLRLLCSQLQHSLDDNHTTRYLEGRCLYLTELLIKMQQQRDDHNALFSEFLKSEIAESSNICNTSDATATDMQNDELALNVNINGDFVGRCYILYCNKYRDFF